MSFNNAFIFQLQRVIQDYGHPITIFYNSSAFPGYLGNFDPVYKEPINVNYSNRVSSAFSVKAVTKQFITGMNFSDLLQKQYGYAKDSDMRLTCWLPDVLMNQSSTTGKTYFDYSNKVRVGTKDYKVKKTFITGLNTLSLLIVLMDELNESAYVNG